MNYLAAQRDRLGEGVDLQFIETMTGNNGRYERSKAKYWRNFCEVCSRNPNYAPLFKEITLPGGSKSIVLIQILRAPITEPKKQILNELLVLWSISIKKVGHEDAKNYVAHGEGKLSEEEQKKALDAMLNSNTVRLKFKHVFAVLSANGVAIQNRHYRGFPGSFKAFWKRLFAWACQHRTDIGSRPNRAKVEKNADYFTRKAIVERRLNLEHYDELLYYLVWQFAKDFARRGTKEINKVKVTDFTHHIETVGPLAGRPYYQLAASNFEKAQSVSLDKPDLRQNNELLQRVYDDPHDPYCTYKMIRLRFEQLLGRPTSF
jgi:hypothetical protein